MRVEPGGGFRQFGRMFMPRTAGVGIGIQVRIERELGVVADQSVQGQRLRGDVLEILRPSSCSAVRRSSCSMASALSCDSFKGTGLGRKPASAPGARRRRRRPQHVARTATAMNSFMGSRRRCPATPVARTRCCFWNSQPRLHTATNSGPMKAVLMMANLMGRRATCISRMPGERRRSNILDIRGFLSSRPAGFGRELAHGGRSAWERAILSQGLPWSRAGPGGFCCRSVTGFTRPARRNPTARCQCVCNRSNASRIDTDHEL